MKLIDIIIEKNIDSHTDKNCMHDYINGFYENEFSKYQDKEISLLEIGVQRGASLLLWKEYFSKGSITGIDIEDQRLDQYKNIERVNYINGDAYTEEIASKVGMLDIIIDDGAHFLQNNILYVNLYLPKLKPNGVLIIEDIQEDWHPEKIKEVIPNKYESKFIDLRRNKGVRDDMVFVVKHKT